MKKTLLLFSIIISFTGYSQNTNLVSNGNMETFTNTNSTPTDWSSASDFGSISQNTTDFVEGASSVELGATFADLFIFTTVAIPLEASKTYNVKYSYKYLGSEYGTSDNIEFKITPSSSTTTPFVNTVNIQNSNWNVVQFQFTPTETNSDYEVLIRITPFGRDNYNVLFDDIQIIESSSLSQDNFNLEKKITVLRFENNDIKLKKASDIIIKEVNIYSILGQKQKLDFTSADSSEFNLNAFSSGIYILKISTNKGNIAKKIYIN